MSVEDPAVKLQKAVDAFTEPLRLGDGVDDASLAELRYVIQRLGSDFPGQMIAKSYMQVLVELYPAILGCSPLYEGEYSERVVAVAEELLEIIQDALS